MRQVTARDPIGHPIGPPGGHRSPEGGAGDDSPTPTVSAAPTANRPRAAAARPPGHHTRTTPRPTAATVTQARAPTGRHPGQRSPPPPHPGPGPAPAGTGRPPRPGRTKAPRLPGRTRPDQRHSRSAALARKPRFHPPPNGPRPPTVRSLRGVMLSGGGGGGARTLAHPLKRRPLCQLSYTPAAAGANRTTPGVAPEPTHCARHHGMQPAPGPSAPTVVPTPRTVIGLDWI